jgi:CIC family chloride channel protein
MERSGAPLWPRPVEEKGLATLFVVSLIVGAAAGAVGASFRASLSVADRLRDDLVAWSHGADWIGFAVVVGACAFATAVAAWLVRRFAPPASGSGIPHVEAVLHDEVPPAPYALAPVKFAGGLLAIGAGLALGREGPTVQMGASIAVLIGRVFRLPRSDCRALLAAGAGAGLATAFNAPLAGAAFVLEELVQSFDRRITISALTASATAIAVARALLGDRLDFRVPALPDVPAEARPLFFALGAVVGLVAIAYNRSLLGTLAAFERLPLPVEARAALIGAAVGALAWAHPGAVGGGDAITEGALTGAWSLPLVALLFFLRFGLGAVSYAAATPGGLFAPLLALGAQFGLLFGWACRWAFAGLDVPAESFALVGMAALFAGVVRAPLTGMVLVSEMTGNVTLLLQMLGACAVAMLVPTLLRDAPIYESLREKLVGRPRDKAKPIPSPRAPEDR